MKTRILACGMLVLVALGGAATARSGQPAIRGAHAILPGGPAPAALVGRYRARFSLDEFRGAPDPSSVPSEDSTQELVILNSSLGGKPELGIHGADGKSGGPPIPFGVKGSRMYLSCLGAGGRPTRAFATYQWSLRGKLLTVKTVTSPCRGNQTFLLTTHVWRKIAAR